MPKPRTPQTRDEWQVAADCAHACLCLDSARLYGLVEGGPQVDVARCQFILDVAKVQHGITPRPDAVERFVEAYMDRGQIGQPHRQRGEG